MKQEQFLEVFVLAERLHRQFLEVIQFELDALNIRDINNIRALILLNIGDAEMTASELLWRGCYLGSNVSYNLKKLTEAGYVIQTRSDHDKRVIMVRNSKKGAELCAILQDMNARHIETMKNGALNTQDLITCGKTLRSLQQFWSRAGDASPNFAGQLQAYQASLADGVSAEAIALSLDAAAEAGRELQAA